MLERPQIGRRQRGHFNMEGVRSAEINSMREIKEQDGREGLETFRVIKVLSEK